LFEPHRAMLDSLLVQFLYGDRFLQRALVLISFLFFSLPGVSLAGGTFRASHAMEYGGAENLNPYDPNRFTPTIYYLYSRLVRPDNKDSPSPDLALSWSGNETATIWRFNLRHEVTFHDGSSFDATDVAYSMSFMLDPAIDSPLISTLGIVDHVEVIDQYTVDMHLKAAHADFPVLLMDYRARIIPEDIGMDIREKGIGTGPFVLSDLDPEGITRLVANPDYFLGPPGLDGIEIIAVNDANARMQALLSDQLDIVERIIPRLEGLFRGNDRFSVQRFPTGDMNPIVFRTDMPPFDDVRVRKAIRVAVDRQKLINTAVGHGGAVVACDHPVWPGDPYRWPGECKQDQALARQLLAEAGYEDTLEFDLYTTTLFAAGVSIAEVYQKQLSEVGVKVNIILAPADGYYGDVWLTKSACVGYWSHRPADQYLNELYRSGGAWNETYWNRPDFDALLDAARAELDFEKRKARYWQAQEMLFEEGGSFMPMHYVNIRVLNAAVKNLEPIMEFAVPWYKVTKD